MSRNGTSTRSTSPSGASSTSTASRRLTVRFPNSDHAVAAFLEAQTNLSMSLRVLVRQYVETHGARDVLSVALVQNAVRAAASTSQGGAAPEPTLTRAADNPASALARLKGLALRTSEQARPAPRQAPVLEGSTQLDMDDIFSMAHPAQFDAPAQR